MPDPVASSIVAASTKDPGILRTCVECIFGYLGQGTPVESYPTYLLAFIKDFPAKQWASTWLRAPENLLADASGLPAWREAFTDALCHFINGEGYRSAKAALAEAGRYA